MTTEIERLSQSIIAEPAALEHRLVAAIRRAAERIALAPEVEAARLSADTLPAGLVITDDQEAANVVDLVAAIIKGEKALAREQKIVLRIPEQMEAAVKAQTADLRARLAAARERGNNAGLAYRAEQRRRAALEEARQKREAEEAAKRAAEEGAPYGEDAPPVAEVAPIVPPRIIAGGAGKQHTQVRTRAVEVVDAAAVPRGWLVLAPVVAKAEFDLAVLKQEVKKPEPGESVVWKGVRFEATETAVNR